jgi:DNA repair photolyase
MGPLVSVSNPKNPWSTAEVDYLGEPPTAPLVVYEDQSRSILSENRSPDLGFRWSLNAYRGCFHGCSYCYARPSHETLSFGAGTDFERRLVVKPRAPELLREALSRPSWRRELVVVSGNTDAYQPLEASYRLTRGCLEVCVEHRTPVHVITKSALVERDLDVLVELERVAGASVAVSIPFLDEGVARALEPFVTTPARRLKTIARLAERGLSVTLLVSPLVPSLSERGLAELLGRARDAGASAACSSMLRLPGPVAEVFEAALRERLPLAAERVLARTREVRGGALYDPRFGVRMTGQGPYADAALALFRSTCERVGLACKPTTLEPGPRAAPHVSRRASSAARAARAPAQLDLFAPVAPRAPLESPSTCRDDSNVG